MFYLLLILSTGLSDEVESFSNEDVDTLTGFERLLQDANSLSLVESKPEIINNYSTTR